MTSSMPALLRNAQGSTCRNLGLVTIGISTLASAHLLLSVTEARSTFVLSQLVTKTSAEVSPRSESGQLGWANSPWVVLQSEPDCAVPFVPHDALHQMSHSFGHCVRHSLSLHMSQYCLLTHQSAKSRRTNQNRAISKHPTTPPALVVQLAVVFASALSYTHACSSIKGH